MLRKRVLVGEIAKRITPHSLRHTFGMAFQRDGKDLNLTAKVLGHASIQTTVRYADHLELAEIRVHMPRWAAKNKSIAS